MARVAVDDWRAGWTHGAVAVYQAWDKKTCLYVGRTLWPKTRFQEHRRKSVWFSLATDLKVDWFPNGAWAGYTERLYIKLYMPAYNIWSTTPANAGAKWLYEHGAEIAITNETVLLQYEQGELW